MKSYTDEALLLKLEEHDWSNYYKIKNPEDCWAYLYTTLITILDDLCPEKEMANVRKKNEWVTPELFELMRARDEKFKKAKKTKDPEEWSIAKSFRNKANEACSKAKNEYTLRKLEEDSGNPRKFWQHIKPLVGKASDVTKATIELDNIGEPKEVPNVLNTFFTTIGTKLKNNIQPLSTDEKNKLNGTDSSIKYNTNKCHHTFRKKSER